MIFDTDDPPPNWGDAASFTGRCDWWIEVCGGGLSCALLLGHDDPGPGAAANPSRPRWHRTWGDTWLHAWAEDNPDAYRRADEPADSPTVAEFVNTEIPRAGDSTTYQGMRITNWGRLGPDGTPRP